MTLDKARTIMAEVGALLDRVRPAEADHAYQLLARSPRVFAFATGRSGFVLRGFIMRLNHLGQPAFYVGDASTPPIAEGDLFVVMSGSGSTATSLGAAMEVTKFGATVLALVGSRVSPLGQLAHAVVELPAPHKRGVPAGGADSRQTAGSLFEQACFMLLEGWIMRRFEEQGRDRAAALGRHANLEA